MEKMKEENEKMRKDEKGKEANENLKGKGLKEAQDLFFFFFCFSLLGNH